MARRSEKVSSTHTSDPSPETFTYKGKTYTPVQWAAEMGLEPESFINFTSYTRTIPSMRASSSRFPTTGHGPRASTCPWRRMQQIVDNALDKGWTVMWAADVSEGGFKWKNGYALLPEEKDSQDMDDTELSRWVKLSDKDREDARYDINKGPVAEKKVTQESRQETFDNFETTDDHGMVIVGTAKDQEGNKYYKVKNSWDTNQIFTTVIFMYPFPSSWRRPSEWAYTRMLSPAGIAARIKR